MYRKTSLVMAIVFAIVSASFDAPQLGSFKDTHSESWLKGEDNVDCLTRTEVSAPALANRMPSDE